MVLVIYLLTLSEFCTICVYGMGHSQCLFSQLSYAQPVIIITVPVKCLMFAGCER